MPTPKTGETEKDFMGRCMSWPDMEKYEQSQRAAICESKFSKNRLVAWLAKDILENVKEDADGETTAAEYEKQFGGPGFFTHCVDSIAADKEDPQAFCGWLHKKLLGYSPGSERKENRSLPWPLNNRMGMEELRQQVQEAVTEDLRFISPAPNPSPMLATVTPWIVDLIPPENGEAWQAVISTGTETYKIEFTVEGDEVVLSDAEPQVTRRVWNSRAESKQKKAQPRPVTLLNNLLNSGWTRIGLQSSPVSKLVNENDAEKWVTPEDGWYHIAPKGEHPHPESGLTQVIDDESIKNMVDRFKEDAKQEHFTGLLVDFDHFSQSVNNSSEAAGWIGDLEGRADGLWAKIRWTDSGKQAVENGRFRLVSPVWRLSDCEDLGEQRIRPNRLDNVALTNQPNLRGLAPLSNRGPDAGAAVAPLGAKEKG